MTAMASTSTRKSGCERRRTSTVVLVGSASPKYSIRTSTCLKNSSMSVVKVCVRTRSAKVAPAAASGFEVLADLADLRAHVAFADDLARAVAREQAGDEHELARDDRHHRRVQHVPAADAFRQRVGKQIFAFNHWCPLSQLLAELIS